MQKDLVIYRPSVGKLIAESVKLPSGLINAVFAMDKDGQLSDVFSDKQSHYIAIPRGKKMQEWSNEMLEKVTPHINQNSKGIALDETLSYLKNRRYKTVVKD